MQLSRSSSRSFEIGGFFERGQANRAWVEHPIFGGITPIGDHGYPGPRRVFSGSKPMHEIFPIQLTKFRACHESEKIRRYTPPGIELHLLWKRPLWNRTHIQCMHFYKSSSRDFELVLVVEQKRKCSSSWYTAQQEEQQQEEKNEYLLPDRSGGPGLN